MCIYSQTITHFALHRISCQFLSLIISPLSKKKARDIVTSFLCRLNRVQPRYFGITNQAIKQIRIPGMPPGSIIKINANRNQLGEIPKNCPNPLQTPATIPFRRRNKFLSFIVIRFFSLSITLTVNTTQRPTRSCISV